MVGTPGPAAPAPIAGLPRSRGTVKVGPPKSNRFPSSGLPSIRLFPPVKLPVTSPPAVCPAMIVLVSVTVAVLSELTRPPPVAPELAVTVQLVSAAVPSRR